MEIVAAVEVKKTKDYGRISMLEQDSWVVDMEIRADGVVVLEEERREERHSGMAGGVGTA